jgi:NitT/TauT family transport system substrate-binding protein
MKKRISLVVIAVFMIFAICGCQKSEQPLKTVKLNEVVHSVFYAPQYVAIEKGFFEDEGIDIDLSVGQGADKSMTALLSGSADIALLGTEAGIYVYNEGAKDYAKPFAQLTQRAGNFLVAREPMPDFKWTDLKGKQIIGGRKGGMPEMLLEYVLKKNGIDKDKDLEIVNNISFESTAGAFSAGQGDFTAEFDPTASALEESGAGYVVASLGTESGYVPYTVYMARKSLIKNDPELLQHFTNAIYKAQIWTQEHTSQEIADVIAPQFKESNIESLIKIIDRYKNQDTWKVNPIFEEENLNLIEDIMENGGELEKRVPYDEFIDTEFADEAVKTIK